MGAYLNTLAALTRVPALRTIALCGVLILVGRDPLLLQAYPALAETVDNLREPQRLNARDTRLHERGYYEDLTDATRFNTELAGLYAHRPADWNVDGGVYQTGGFPPYAMLPSHQVIYKGVVQATNRWGMRDRDYEQSKPSGVFRVALLGSSHSKGSGVSADVNYENVAEDALNSENADGSRRRIEILNFSVGGYGPLCRLALLEEKVLSFQPDLVVFEGIDDFTWIVNEMANAVDKGIAIPFGPIVELMERAGAGPGLARIVAEQKLRPHAGEALEWTCRRFVETCRRNGAKPVAIFLPRPEIIRGESQLLSDQSELARRTGFEVIDMSQAYGAVADKRKLWIAPWDQHPNATGHRLLAERFLAGLRRELPVRNESTQTEKDSTHETDDGA